MNKKLQFVSRRNGKQYPNPKLKEGVGTALTYSTPVMKNTFGEIFFNEFEKISSALNQAVPTESKEKPDEVK